jgi:hypothetical protein
MGASKASQRLLLEIGLHLDQSHSHLKHWEMQPEFQTPLSAAGTSSALLSFNVHLQSASLEWLLQRHEVWKLKERAIWTVRGIFGWNSSIQKIL